MATPPGERSSSPNLPAMGVWGLFVRIGAVAASVSLSCLWLMSLVLVHTDGSCWPNPGGPGGWACVIEMDGKQVELKGSHPGPTSNNRMEIQAAIEALKVLVGRKEVLIHTDSKYLRNAAVTWIKLWKKRGWVTKEGGPVKNRDLWEELDALMAMHDVKWKWVKAHADHYNENNRCDAMANNMRLKVERDHLSDLLLNHDAEHAYENRVPEQRNIAILGGDPTL